METKEMNFFDLCIAIGRGCKTVCTKILAFLGKCIRLTYRQWWVVAPVVVVMLAAAVYYCRPSNRSYQVCGIVTLNGVSPLLVTQSYHALDNCDRKFREQNLPTMLGLDSAVVAKTSTFKAHDLIDMMADSTIDCIDWKDKMAKDDSMTLHVKNMLALTFVTKKPNEVSVIGNAVVDYLNRQPAFQKQYQSYYEGLFKESTFNHTQLSKLDSLTTRFYFNDASMAPISLDGANVVMGTRYMGLFLHDIYKHIYIMKHVDDMLAICSAPVVITQPFTIVKQLHPLITTLIIALLFGWILGLILAYIKENCVEIRNWLKQ